MTSPETPRDIDPTKTDALSQRAMAMAEDLEAILDLARRHNLGNVTAMTTGEGLPSFTTDAGLAYINEAAEAGIKAVNKRRVRQVKQKSKH